MKQTNTPTTKDPPSSAFASAEEMSPPPKLQGNGQNERERRRAAAADEELASSSDASSDEEMRPGAVAAPGVFSGNIFRSRQRHRDSDNNHEEDSSEDEESKDEELAPGAFAVGDREVRLHKGRLTSSMNVTDGAPEREMGDGDAICVSPHNHVPDGRPDSMAKFLMKRSCWKGSNQKYLALVLIAIVAVTIGIVVPLLKKDNSPEAMVPVVPGVVEDQAAPTAAPTVSPTSSERLDEFLNALQKISNRTLLDDPTTPQFLAARWLANVDGARHDLTETTSNMVGERYLMALTYFATDPDVSSELSSLGFLSEASVCSWNDVLVLDGTSKGVFCENGNNVANISLRKVPLLLAPCLLEVPHFL
jgi:hypothetical protein